MTVRNCDCFFFKTVKLKGFTIYSFLKLVWSHCIIVLIVCSMELRLLQSLIHHYLLVPISLQFSTKFSKTGKTLDFGVAGGEKLFDNQLIRPFLYMRQLILTQKITTLLCSSKSRRTNIKTDRRTHTGTFYSMCAQSKSGNLSKPFGQLEVDSRLLKVYLFQAHLYIQWMKISQRVSVFLLLHF